MSGFGLGGFGSGFLAGFEVMGAQLARRGLMQREAEQSRRADRAMALEEELRRQEAARQEREAISQNAQRDLETDMMRAKYPYVGRSAELSVQGQELGNQGQGLENQALQAKLPYVGQSAEAQVQGQQLQNAGQTLQNQATQAKMPYVAPSAAAQVEGQQLDNATTKAKLPYVGQSAAQQVEGQRLDNQGKGLANQGEAAKLPYVAEMARLGVQGQDLSNQGRQLDNQGKALEVDQAQRQEQTRQQASQAWERLDRGEGTPDDVKRIYPLLGAVTNPEHESDVATVFGALQEAAKNGGSVVPFNKPEVMGPLNRTFGETINVTRGMPITRDGRYVVGDSELVQMIKHPTENLLGFEIRVRPEPSPERRAEIEDEMQTANPARRRELEAELNPEPYQTGLTTQRTPVAQGGQMRWFTPQEVQGMVMGMKGISDFRASRPELVQELSRLKQRIDTGEIGGAADLDTALKLKRDARADRKEQLDIERGERGARIERQKIKAGQRQEARQSYEIGAQMIEDSYTLTGPDGQEGLSMDAGPKMNAEKLELARILKHDPTLTGPEAYARVKKRMAKQNAASMAQSGVKPPESKMGRLKQLFGGEPEPKKDFSQLWN